MNSKDYDHLFKIIILGDSGVGKTAILNRFSDDTFNETYSTTVGIDFKIRTVMIEGKRVKLQLWDTAGQERFRTLVASYYRGAHGTILAYDVTSTQSFENVKNWVSEIDSHNSEGISKIILANKCDLVTRQVSSKEGEKLADEIGVAHIEVSAKQGLRVNEAFNSLASTIYQRMKPMLTAGKNESTDKSTLQLEIASKNTTCCQI